MHLPETEGKTNQKSEIRKLCKLIQGRSEVGRNWGDKLEIVSKIKIFTSIIDYLAY